MKISLLPFLSLPFAAAFAALRSVGPDYARPTTAASAAYRDATDPNAWKSVAPADTAARGEWWKLFADPALDALETRALAANQDLQAAAARVEEARAAAGLVRGAGRPQLVLEPSASRARTSATNDIVFPQDLTTSYNVPLVASWELDLFGRIRRQNESARADAAASAATFESLRLALTADVAENYFSLHALDRELAAVQGSAALRQRELDLVSARLKAGAAAEFDVARAETELADAEAESSALGVRRAALQNALAVLVGESAANFSLPEAPALNPLPPAVPAGLPADLLERRPDVAAAERSLVAANARIGVAKAAFFPAISLTGSAGYASGDLDRLFEADSRIWSIGPGLYLPLFQGGRNHANLERSRAAYDEAVAIYRQRVLVAFREVQDALTATRLLADQSAAQDRALAAAQRAARLAQVRYDAGYVSYLEVIDAQRTALASERAVALLGGQRYVTSVALIKSLGGVW
ncbi:MAG TPA: efflux transporter outer membrane subunit [Opitutaceae bacterium]|nr:efflux transporter outer membrane subunit [Opitutaceae bacterium]